MARTVARLAIMALVVALGLGCPTPSRAAPPAWYQADSYTSPTFGYTINWWDAWTVDGRSTAGDEDMLRLTNGTSLVTFVGLPFPGDAPACVINTMENLRAGSGISDVELAKHEMNLAAPRASGDEHAYSALYTYSREAADGTVSDLFTHVSCYVLTPNESAPLVIQLGPRDAMNGQIAALVGLLESLERPDAA